MASLYVRNLPEDVTKQMLQEKFRPAGDIQSIHISKDVKSGRPLGYAYVNFERQADAMCAIATLNKDVISGKPMHIRCAQRIIPLTKASEGKIFVNHLDKSINSVALYKIFCDFGNILSCKVPYDMNGCKGYGFIEFDDQSAAEESIKTMNGVLFNGQKVYVGPLKSLKERQAEQDARARRRVEQQQTFYQGVNLFVKNLDEEVDDERLQEQFSPFGTITSAKVMMKDRRSKGYGFVCFSSPEEASRALKEMNGHVLTNKPLYVALAQSKEERQAHLTNQRVQPTSIKDASTVTPNQLVQNPVGEMSALGLNEHEATMSVPPQLTENIGSPPDTVVATSVAPVDEVHQSKVDTSVCSTKQDMNAQTEAIADVWITVTKRRPRKRN